MKKIFSAKLDSHRLALGLALTLGTASLAQAQTAPATVLALGNVTQAFTFQGITYPAGSQTLTALDPSTGTNSTISPLGALYAGYPIVTGAGQPLGIATGQTLVGIDYRTANGDLYALGFNPNAAAPSANAQLYILRVNNATQRAELTSVGMAIRLELSDANRTNTRGVIPNIGFDFNPRVDRIRVVAPNRANYLLNPNTGGVAAQDGALFYAAGGSVTPPNALPYVGTAAYTNARLGLRGTTLYDIDVTAGNATLSTQAPLNTGQLNPQAATQFFLPSATAGNQGPFPLTSPTVGLGLDIYDATTAYLVEARLQNNSETTISANTLYTSNFYTLNLSTGLATRVANIAGGVPFFYSDLAAPVVSAKAWTGQVSDAWDNANNWFPMGVPTSADDVLIAGNGTFIAAANLSVARQPVVRNAQQTASLTLTNNALLITAGSGIVTMSGDFTNNDSQVTGAGSGSIVLAGTTPLDIGGNVRTDFWNLDIGAAGATTSAPIAIQRGIVVGGTLAIGNDQEFTLLSNANGTAYVVNNGGSVTGLATVQRYITPTNAGAGYRHYSSPVTRNAAAATSNTVADLATASGFTPTVNGAYNSANNPRLVQPYPTVFAYEQSRLATSNAAYAVGDFDNGFVSPSALTDVLATGRGYTVNIGGTQLVDFQGTLNTGNYSTGPLARGAQSNAGWHLLGNPYPGAISYSTLYGAATGVQDGLYVYKSNGQYTGAYSAYLSNGQGVNGGVNNIALGQGFFVRVQPGQTGAVNFTDAARTNQPETALFQRTASTTPTLAMTLRSGSAANQTRIYFAAGATSAFDNGYDAHYLAASHGLDLASDIVTDALAINGLPLLTGAAVAVPLRLHAAVAGTYTLAVDELANLPASYRAYLRDGRTGSYTDLAATPSLPLTLTPADAATGRYAVVFATAQPLAAAPAALAALVGVYPNPAHGTATLVLPQALRGQASSEITVVNMVGQVVLRRTVAAGSPEAVELPLSALAAGMYTVRATTATGTVAKQLSVE